MGLYWGLPSPLEHFGVGEGVTPHPLFISHTGCKFVAHVQAVKLTEDAISEQSAVFRSNEYTMYKVGNLDSQLSSASLFRFRLHFVSPRKGHKTNFCLYTLAAASWKRTVNFERHNIINRWKCSGTLAERGGVSITVNNESPNALSRL